MTTAKVNFNEQIGSDFWCGGITLDFVRYCVEGPTSFDPAAAPNYPQAVELHFFNCPGGEVFEGYGIYAYLRTVAQAGVAVSAHIHGLCASIASLVVLAADTRLIGPLGTVMIHKPLLDAGAWANADDHRRAADELDTLEAQISAIYLTRTAVVAAELPALMRAETLFGAADATANGFATGLLADATPAPAAADAPAKAPAKVLNYAKPKPLAAMATLTETEEKGLFAKFKSWFADETPKPAAKAAKPKADATPAPAAAPAPAPVAMAMTEFPLSDGTSVYVDTSDDGIADIDAGDAVWVDEAMTTPVADGSYTLEDGRGFTVESGSVTAIDDAADASNEAAAPATNAAKPAPSAPKPSTPVARLKVAEARAERAEAQLAALVPGSAGNPNKPGAQVFADNEGHTDTHPLAEAAKKVAAKAKAQL
jgi:ATP-dependent protease ClpP protease subunit